MLKTLRVLLVVLAVSFLSSLTWAQAVGKVEKTEGAPEVLRLGTTSWILIKTDDTVSVGDQLRTREAAKLEIRLNDESLLTLAERTLIIIDEQTLKPSGQNTSIFSLLLGKVRAAVSDRYKEPGARFEVRTPTAVAGVRGTEFIAETTGAQSKFFGVESETVVQPKGFVVCQRFKGCGS